MQDLSANTKDLLVKKLSELRNRGISSAGTSQLTEQFSVEFAYNLGAINGSNLKLNDAYKIASDSSVLASPGQIQKFKNIRKALDLIVGSAIKDQILEQNIVEKVSELTLGAPLKLGKTLAWLRSYERLEHPIDLAAKFIVTAIQESTAVEEIVFLFVNHILLRARLPLAILLYNDRKRYQRLLAIAKQGKVEMLAEFIAQAVLRSIEIHLEASDPDDCSREHISLQKLSESSPYSEAYLRKLALSGKLAAYKIGRNWLSTQSALDDYIRSHQRGKTSKL